MRWQEALQDVKIKSSEPGVLFKIVEVLEFEVRSF